MTDKRFISKSDYDWWYVKDITGKFKREYSDWMSDDEVVECLNALHEENQTLQRHIERNTFNKIRVEDILNCAKYDRFYDNEEAIKSIEWIAEEIGVDFYDD